MPIEIRHEVDDPPYGAFRAYDDDGAIASMVYVSAGEGVIAIMHTGVETRGEGRHIGSMLFEFLVAWARATGTKIVPRCPFTRRQFQKRPETADVLR